jgi:hypothetical protein
MQDDRPIEYIGDLNEAVDFKACSVGWWLMAGAGSF